LWRINYTSIDTVGSSDQARNQLGTPGGAKSFPRGAQLFLTMSNNFKLCSTHFSRGDKKILGGLWVSSPLRPVVTGLVQIS